MPRPAELRRAFAGVRVQVFAVDPGGVTGWARMDLPAINLVDRSTHLFEDCNYECGQVTGPEVSQARQLAWLVEIESDNFPVIIEDFILREFRQDRNLLSPVRITAMLEYAISGYGDIKINNRIRKQQPSLAKSTATDDRLTEWGLWEKGKPHARDALRHAVTFLRRACGDQQLRRWGWPDVY